VYICIVCNGADGEINKIMYYLIEASAGTGFFQVQQGAGTVIGQFQSIDQAEMAFESRMREILSESDGMRHSDLFLVDENRERV
jgi:hypothetical protein